MAKTDVLDFGNMKLWFTDSSQVDSDVVEKGDYVLVADDWFDMLTNRKGSILEVVQGDSEVGSGYVEVKLIGNGGYRIVRRNMLRRLGNVHDVINFYNKWQEVEIYLMSKYIAELEDITLHCVITYHSIEGLKRTRGESLFNKNLCTFSREKFDRTLREVFVKSMAASVEESRIEEVKVTVRHSVTTIFTSTVYKALRTLESEGVQLEWKDILLNH